MFHDKTFSDVAFDFEFASVFSSVFAIPLSLGLFAGRSSLVDGIVAACITDFLDAFFFSSVFAFTSNLSFLLGRSLVDGIAAADIDNLFLSPRRITLTRCVPGRRALAEPAA